MSASTLVRAMLLFAPAALARHVPLPASLVPSGELQLERARQFCVKRNEDTAAIEDQYAPVQVVPIREKREAVYCRPNTAAANLVNGKTFLPGGKCSGDGKTVLKVPMGKKSGDTMYADVGTMRVEVKIPGGIFSSKKPGDTFKAAPWVTVAKELAKKKQCANTYVEKSVGGEMVLQVCSQRTSGSLFSGCVKSTKSGAKPDLAACSTKCPGVGYQMEDDPDYAQNLQNMIDYEENRPRKEADELSWMYSKCKEMAQAPLTSERPRSPCAVRARPRISPHPSCLQALVRWRATW